MAPREPEKPTRPLGRQEIADLVQKTRRGLADTLPDAEWGYRWAWRQRRRIVRILAFLLGLVLGAIVSAIVVYLLRL